MKKNEKADKLNTEPAGEDTPKTADRPKKTYAWVELLCFAAFWTILLFVLSYICDPISRGRADLVQERDAYVAAAMTAPKDSIDVVVLGDSEAMVLLWPELYEQRTGKNAFIAGQSGQIAAEAYYTLRSMKNQTPKTAVVEADMLVSSANERSEAIGSFNAALQELLPVFRYHVMWKEAFGLKEPALIKHDRGFGKRLAAVAYTGGEYMTPSDGQARILTTSRKYFEKIRKLCEERNIRLVLVSGIVPKTFNYEKHNALQALADQNGLTYIDLNEISVREEMGIDNETDFLDGGDHVNASGSIKVTEYLSKVLDNNE
ncbi:MAG: hypothetical protein K6E75_02140 [Lachnospiraceae bacterium]|nr:hypothetical protein [Lachnospiraceae bacterium]